MSKPEVKSRVNGAIGIVVFSLPLIVLLFLSLVISGGHFTYTLDDPYIHLALARHIWIGTYGINLNEFSAPSSSILWPFLLTPFSLLGSYYEMVPLLFNALCVVLTGFVISVMFIGQGRIVSQLFALGLMLALNIYGLAFTGMEHSLQVLLVTFIAFGLVSPDSIARNRHVFRLFYACLIVLPLVRYEGLAISLPVLLYRMANGDKKVAIRSIICIVASLLSFSAFLHVHGLGLLPSSVLAKSAHTGFSATFDNLVSNLRYCGWVFAGVFAFCLYLWSEDRRLALTVFAVTVLHFVFGKFGWYGRYEVYYLVFVVLQAFSRMTTRYPKCWISVFVLPFAFPSLTYATLTTPLGASNIYNQQGQMAAIARLIDDKVAVNDLGLVALRTDKYVLDLWGLGSIDALFSRTRSHGDPGWIQRLMKEKGVSYAMVYDSWFPQIPPDWIKVGELKLLQKRITPASDTVSFYATSRENALSLKKLLVGWLIDTRSKDFSIVLSKAPP